MADNYGLSKVSYAWENRRRWLDLPFPVEEYERRVSALRAAMERAGLDALLVYGNPNDQGNVRWLSNFPSFFGNTIVVLSGQGEPVLATDSVMHSEPMHSEIWTTWIRDIRWAHHPATVRSAGNMTDHVRDALAEFGCLGRRVGLVGESAVSSRTMADLTERLRGTTLVPATELYLQVKRIRSPREIEYLRAAARQASRGLEAIMDLARPGVSEFELAGAAAKAMFEAGAHELSFPPAVTSGPRAGLKHSYPTGRKLEAGDFVFADVGTSCYGYLSDVCRTFIVGRPDRAGRKMQETALEMQRAFIAGVRPGARICDLQKRCEDIAVKAGYGDYYYPTGIGHGIGTSIAEIPLLFPDSEARLEAGMTFALEPMIVIEDVGCSVYEDVILVTEDGAEELSDARKIIAKDAGEA